MNVHLSNNLLSCRWVIMPHVKEHIGSNAKIVLHRCPKEIWYPKWTKLINRQGFSVSKHTRVCSNHFKYGQPREQEPHPTLFLKGYECKPGRKPPLKRELFRKQYEQDHSCTDDLEASPPAKSSEEYENEIKMLKEQNEMLEDRIKHLENDIEKLTVQKKFGIHSINHSDYLVKVHTGLPSYALFSWIFNEVKDVAVNMKYYKGEQSLDTKSYQESNGKKPGPKRKLSMEDELLMTIMKLRLNLNLEFLASMFQVSVSLVSSVVSTWIILLSKELVPLIHWPSHEELTQYYPQCFEKYGTVSAIIDCTEVQTERPTLDSANSMLFSNYKGRHTYKALIACTPGGTVSYVSQVCGGDMSDVDVVRKSGLLNKIKKNDKIMADKGFSNKDDFLMEGAQLITPEILRKDTQFTVAKNVVNAEISNARIHVERVIGRMKDFKILQGPIRLAFADIVDHIFVVCGCMINLMGILVPLKSKSK